MNITINKFKWKLKKNIIMPIIFIFSLMIPFLNLAFLGNYRSEFIIFSASFSAMHYLYYLIIFYNHTAYCDLTLYKNKRQMIEISYVIILIITSFLLIDILFAFSNYTENKSVIKIHIYMVYALIFSLELFYNFGNRSMIVINNLNKIPANLTSLLIIFLSLIWIIFYILILGFPDYIKLIFLSAYIIYNTYRIKYLRKRISILYQFIGFPKTFLTHFK